MPSMFHMNASFDYIHMSKNVYDIRFYYAYVLFVCLFVYAIITQCYQKNMEQDIIKNALGLTPKRIIIGDVDNISVVNRQKYVKFV